MRSFICFLLAILPSAALAAPPATMFTKPDAMRDLTDFSLAGLNRRLGPDYSVYHRTEEKLPDIYLVPAKPFPKGKRVYQYGEWQNSAGDFSSSQGQLLWAANNAFGIDRVTTVEWTNGVFTEIPLPPWNSGFRPEPTSKKWPKDIGVPIGVARGMGGWSNCGLVLFSSGFIGTAGTVTAHGSNPTAQLPRGKVPTAISVTNKNEFALVTCIDIEKRRGQVAVFALGSSGRGHFAHEWQDEYPGLANVGLLTSIKLLGFVDLPTISFPTSISAVGNHIPGRMNGRDGNAGVLKEYDLANQADRDVFNTGGNKGFASTAGWAVVGGKYENKAVFIDLQSLFERMRTAYLTSEEEFKKTRDLGPAPRQWPYTFDVEPAMSPKVIATVDVPQPTAVIASMTGGRKARACIASLDGKLTTYAVGGLATTDPAEPDDVTKIAEITVGKNPCQLAYSRGNKWDTFMLVSRGDREIAWLKLNDDGTPTITRSLRDARLVDPVYVEQQDTHGYSAGVITVCDFKGRKILNYRYTPLHFATQGGAKFGMGEDGTADFECGGVMDLPGGAFAISATNVN